MRLPTLGRNPLQNTLIDSATMPIFGDPVTAQEAEAITAQQDQVEAIMHDGYWHTLPEIVKELRRRYGRLCGEASVSARIRAMRKRGYTVARARTRAGSNLYQYRATKHLTHDEVRQIHSAEINQTITAMEGEAEA